MPELPSPNISKPVLASETLNGIAVRKGLATGRVYLLDSAFPSYENEPCENVSAEAHFFKESIATATDDLKAIVSGLPSKSEEKLIFEAHKLMLQDPVLMNQVTSYIQAKQVKAASAWVKVMSDYQKMWESAGAGSSLHNRSSDIADVTKRVLRVMKVDVSKVAGIPDEAILVTEELSASDALQLDRSRVRAVISERGNDTSHSAILIRSMGIPAIFGVKDACKILESSEIIFVDADRGVIHRKCNEAFIEEFRSKMSARNRVRGSERVGHASAVSGLTHSAHSSSGDAVELLANITDPSQIKHAFADDAAGVGLFRTEFLYFNRTTPPTAEEQFSVYKNAVVASNGKKLVIRTADFGGDKPLAYTSFPTESNPFLGLRGIRFSLAEHEMLETQLFALLRASAQGPIDIMIPMISSVDEIRKVKSLINQIKENVHATVKQDLAYRLGIMIETPSAVNMIEELLAEVDFISIGTNDLIQYTMSADRTNERVAELASGWQPAVLRAIARTISAANEVGKSVSICGEMAGDPDFAPLLIAFGLREFSMSTDSIQDVRATINNLTQSQITEIQNHFMNCATAFEIQNLVQSVLAQNGN